MKNKQKLLLAIPLLSIVPIIITSAFGFYKKHSAFNSFKMRHGLSQYK